MPIPYKSFCWSLGTTSFRTKDFNRTIELQLFLLDEFWKDPKNATKQWSANSDLQEKYYDFMQEKGFLSGEANNKPKDAREKTSGLVDIGLINDDRKLTPVGKVLLDISQRNDFSADNFFEISKDSYIYLKQLLKTYNCVDGDNVRPFVVMLYILSKVDYLTLEEYTYLLPLCINNESTEQILQGINQLRKSQTTVDEIIISRLMSMNNYQEALEYFLSNSVSESIVCEIGLNRKSRQYDKDYYGLFNALKSVFVDKDIQAAHNLYLATKKINIGKLWRAYLFNTSSETRIANTPSACMNHTKFAACSNLEQLKIVFFKIMHLFKAKATLSDYLDLNRRYIKTTDIVLFEDETVKLDIVPKHFFKTKAEQLKSIAFIVSTNLTQDCTMTDIAPFLQIKEQEIIDGVNDELDTKVTTITEAHKVLEDKRYERLEHLIDSKFTDDKILTLLSDFENRNDEEIRSMVTDNADVPTIFEYVLGLLWYKVSERRGKILDYMKLSLDAELLPKTHAAGGEADIVYEYEATSVYPEHSLLLEATLADSTNQRRMEMEPVSRHLGNHLIRTGNLNSYCVFATNDLNVNVISDFRSRKTTMFYDTSDYSKFVEGMKIMPLQTSDLKNIVKAHKNYKQLYVLFDTAYTKSLPPHLWYEQWIQQKIAK